MILQCGNYVSYRLQDQGQKHMVVSACGEGEMLQVPNGGPTYGCRRGRGRNKTGFDMLVIVSQVEEFRWKTGFPICLEFVQVVAVCRGSFIKL